MNKNLKRLGIGGLLMIVISGGVWYFGDKQRTMNVAEKIELAGVQARIFNKITYKIGEIREMTKKPKELMIFNSREGAVKEDEELIKVFKDNKNVLNSEKVDISNWKTYRNDHYGYVISYPTDWSVYERNYNKDRLTFKRIILNFLSKFMIINPNYPRPTLKTIEFYITKDCNLDELKEHNKMCPNYVKISTHDMTSSSCGVRVENGKLPITTLSAFNNIFTLKEGEDREALQYKKDNFSLSGFVFNNTVMGIYKFINEDDIIDNLTSNDGSCYSIEIKDSTNERKYLKIEKAIIDSLQIINKIK
jgi:hypothetical protein